MPIWDPAAEQPVSEVELQVARRLLQVATELVRCGDADELIEHLATRLAERGYVRREGERWTLRNSTSTS